MKTNYLALVDNTWIKIDASDRDLYEYVIQGNITPEEAIALSLDAEALEEMGMTYEEVMFNLAN